MRRISPARRTSTARSISPTTTWPTLRGNPDVHLTILDRLKSEVYVARLRAEDAERIHTVLGTARAGCPVGAKILFLAPTVSYMAYVNARGHFDSWAKQPIVLRPPIVGEADLFLAEHTE